MRIVVTGGIGSGKSSFAKALASFLPQHQSVSVDKIVASIGQLPAVSQAVAARFGTSDRRAVSAKAFSNPSDMAFLENLVNPMVCDELRLLLPKGADAVVEFPLWVERNGASLGIHDLVVSVLSSPEAARARAEERDADRPGRAARAASLQTDDKTREMVSDIVVRNDSDMESLIRSARSVAAEILCRQTASSGGKAGIVSGSFDPFTMGHAWIVEKALSIVDTVVVSVANNPAKKGMFDFDERISLVERTLSHTLSPSDLRRVVLDVLPEKSMLVGRAGKLGASFVFRGIRNSTDFEYERQIDLVQNKIAPDILTVYLVPDRRLTEISSSMIKGLAGLDGWREAASGYVAPCVIEAMAKKIA